MLFMVGGVRNMDNGVRHLVGFAGTPRHYPGDARFVPVPLSVVVLEQARGVMDRSFVLVAPKQRP